MICNNARVITCRDIDCHNGINEGLSQECSDWFACLHIDFLSQLIYTYISVKYSPTTTEVINWSFKGWKMLMQNQIMIDAKSLN